MDPKKTFSSERLGYQISELVSQFRPSFGEQFYASEGTPCRSSALPVARRYFALSISSAVISGTFSAPIRIRMIRIAAVLVCFQRDQPVGEGLLCLVSL